MTDIDKKREEIIDTNKSFRDYEAEFAEAKRQLAILEWENYEWLHREPVDAGKVAVEPLIKRE